MAESERELDKEINDYRFLTFSHNTKRTYASHLRAYLGFCQSMNYPPVPVTHIIVCRYAAFLARRLSASSVKKYLNIIRLLHLEAGLPNPLSHNWFLDSVLRGIMRKKGVGTCRKLPITPYILLRLKSVLNPANPVDIVFWAACLLGFFAFLRKSNLFAPSTTRFDPSKHLRRGDLTIFPWGVAVSIRWSKTIQFGERAFVAPLPWLHGHPLCPVTAIVKAFSVTRGAEVEGPAFVIPTQGGFIPFLPSRFVTMLKSYLGKLGYKPELYSGHSFRRGAASWALQKGLPGETIKILGDWKSDAYLDYLSLNHSDKLRSMIQFSDYLPSTT